MKNVDIPKSALISILIGIISLWVLVSNGLEVASYYSPLDLALLSEQNIKAGRYVRGTITDCVTVPLCGNQDILTGTDSELIGAFGRTYNSYTIPVLDEHFIRVWLYGTDSIEEMERIVNGDTLAISFVGKIQKGGTINSAWYDWNPDFDQSKLVTGYFIMQKTIDVEKNLCVAGLFGLVIAGLIYYFGDKIRVEEVQPKQIQYEKFTYNKENELYIAKKNLEKYEELEKKYRIKKIVGIVCVVIGFLIFFGTKLIWIGLIFVIYGIKKWCDFFINSRNRYAKKFAKLFSIKTLQTQRAEEERKLEMLEEESLTN